MGPLQTGSLVREQTVDCDGIGQQRGQPLSTQGKELQLTQRRGHEHMARLDPGADGMNDEHDHAEIPAPELENTREKWLQSYSETFAPLLTRRANDLAGNSQNQRAAAEEMDSTVSCAAR